MRGIKLIELTFHPRDYRRIYMPVPRQTIIEIIVAEHILMESQTTAKDKLQPFLQSFTRAYMKRCNVKFQISFTKERGPDTREIQILPESGPLDEVFQDRIAKCIYKIITARRAVFAGVIRRQCLSL